MAKENISRKQALKQLGGFALGSVYLSPLRASGRSSKQHIQADYKKTNNVSSKRPPIIFLMADQWRADALGCAGNEAIKTPNLDTLVQDGVLFNNAYSAAPTCTPARACLLTGLNPWNNGLLGYGRVARKYKYEMPRMIRNAGYHAYGVGKNHWFPQKSLHGFHGTIVDEGRRLEQDGFVSDYHDWFKQQAPGKKPTATGLNWNGFHGKAYALNEKMHRTHWTGKTAVDFIKGYDLGKPLYLKVSFVDPHSPYEPPQRFLDMYRNVDIPAPVIGGKGMWDERFDYRPTNISDYHYAGNFGKAQAIKSRRYYYATITFVDEQIGNIIKALKQKGMYDDAIITFCSDHGNMLGDHYLWQKTYAYEGSAKIPFIFKWPKGLNTTISRGESVSEPVGLQDFLPTFLQATGQQIPKDMDGMSLLSLLCKNKSAWRKYIGIEHATGYRKNDYWAGVTDGRFKYLWFFRTGEEQFFDLRKDPREVHNLAREGEKNGKLQAWRNRLIDHLVKRGPGFVKDNHLVKRKKRMIYSPNYPRFDESKKGLSYWKSEVSLRI